PRRSTLRSSVWPETSTGSVAVAARSSGSAGSRRYHSPSAAPRVRQEWRRASAESAPNGGPAPSVQNPERPGRPSRLAEEACGGRLDVCEDPGVGSTHDDEPEADVDQPVDAR